MAKVRRLDISEFKSLMGKLHTFCLHDPFYFPDSLLQSGKYCPGNDAVTDIQLALVEHPDNPQLERLLIAAYQNEVSLLRQAMELVDKS